MKARRMPPQPILPIKRLNVDELEGLRQRRTARAFRDPSLEAVVQSILKAVQQRGDAALFDFTRDFDGVDLSQRGLVVTDDDVRQAYDLVDRDALSALTTLKDRIAQTERRLIETTGFLQQEDGLTIHHAVTPLQSVGCYVPGGLAAYPSTLLMTAVPATVAGVPRIVVCSPPSVRGEIHPLILVAADLCGVTEIYRVGGAQAIAALAYGTPTIAPVMKIVGPGRRIVAVAKTLVASEVAVDLPAGPSELLVVADDTADPRFIARDLLSQAEHGPDTIVGVVTPSEVCAQRVIAAVEALLPTIERGEIIGQSLATNGFVILCQDLAAAVHYVNAFAPEHVEILTRDPSAVAARIVAAGLILLGSYTPVAGSDYGFGTNHVLPTGGFSRTYSGLSALDFVKRVNVVTCTKERLKAMAPTVQVLARSEGLPNHALAVQERVTP